MIRYALLCEHDHDFEAWFSNSSDYDAQAERGLVECPFCASKSVRKAIMSPAVSGTKKREAPSPEQAAQARTMMMEAVKKVREHVEENFDYVGDAFAKEARKIHAGESENRGIYGEATPKEVRALKEDGISVAALPVIEETPKTKIN
ncbi:MAG: DUF1178 family protein [Proteobacteria bacterium]|nr:DUF1178 family protein [Pseudomonadota bacterium]